MSCGRLSRAAEVLATRFDAARKRSHAVFVQPLSTKCRKYFSADLSDLAPPGSQYTHRVMDLAVRLVVEDGLPYRPASWHLWRDHRVFVPFATIQNWVEAGGKKGAGAHGHGLP
jgi:hypothetical protein